MALTISQPGPICDHCGRALNNREAAAAAVQTNINLSRELQTRMREEIETQRTYQERMDKVDKRQRANQESIDQTERLLEKTISRNRLILAICAVLAIVVIIAKFALELLGILI